MDHPFTYEDIAGMIDHTCLAPNATDAELDREIEVAKKYRTAAFCMKPYYTAAAARALAGSGVRVCTVVGFPHGSNRPCALEAEARCACKDGATELDMVVNIGKVLSGDWDTVADGILAVQNVALENKALVKVIFETFYLNDEQKIRLCEVCSQIGVAFVKTATGFAGGGATLHDVELMRRSCPREVGVKAAGGIRSLYNVLRFREAGATRIGTSAAGGILEEVRMRLARW